MKKNIFTIVFFIILPYFCFSQDELSFARYENNTFEDFRALEVRDITSDYNSRNAGPGATIFHMGVDVNPTEGHADYVLLAPFAGTIEEIIDDGIIKLM